MITDWIKRIERDVLALGSIVFYFLVLGRALVGPFVVLITQLITAGVILFLIYIVHRRFDTYLARGIILAIFTSLFYDNTIYLVFVSIVFVIMILSSYHIGSSKQNILKGVIFGAIGSVIGYFASVYFVLQ